MLTSTLLQLLNNQPIGFIDVGARGGVHTLVEPIAPAVAVLGFEPDKGECERILSDPRLRGRYAKVEIEPIAIAARAGDETLYELSAPTNSSLLPPNPLFVQRYDMQKWQEVGRSTIATTTLDDVVFGARASEGSWGEVVKLDTQGTEYDILRGAERTLRERTVFLAVEVSFCELYKGQKLFSDIEILLRERGFSFYGFDHLYNRSRKFLDKRCQWGRERVIQADAYFFRDPFDHASRPDGDMAKRRNAILAVMALLTGYHDFAIELLDSLGGDAGELRDAVLRRAALPAAQSVSAAESLWTAVQARPQEANVLVGKFVDERRGCNDYQDIPV